MLLRLTVSKIVQETADAISIHFPQPRVHKVWYKAGQFITLAVEIEGKRHFRSYSISTAPRLDETLAITVKKVAGGLVSRFLNEHVKVGDSFDAMRPSGRFFIENSVKFERKIILIAGGSGITPIMSILRSVLFNEPKSHVVLFFANSSMADIIFHEELKRLEKMFPQRLQLFHFISDLKEKEGHYFPGRLHEKLFLHLLEKSRQDGKKWQEERFYLCGPAALMVEARRCLTLAKIPDNQLFEEHFYAAEKVEIADALSQEAQQVEVAFSGEKYAFSVPGGTSVLDAALQQDIFLPHSCRRGICSTCIGKQISGKISMAKNEALTDWEVQQGYILVCQAFPQDDKVKIEIGPSF